MARRGLLAMCLVLGLFVPHTVCAHRPEGRYSMQVEDEWGRELPVFHKGSHTYVLGTLGERYRIRLQNFSDLRVEAVVTVDGRDVISGRSGDFVNERGYLLEPYGEVVIEGFRRSYSDVAAFRFSHPSDSYSSRMGTPENVGIVGAAFFPERSYARSYPRPEPRPQRIAPPEPYVRKRSVPRGLGTSSGAPRSSAPAEASDRAAEAASESAGRRASSGASSSYRYDDYHYQPYAEAERDNLGTEYGESVRSDVREVPFERANPRTPSAVVTVRYDDERGLEARGIRVRPRRPVAHATPQAFPHNRFAPPPP